MRKLDDWLNAYLRRFKRNEAPFLFKVWAGIFAIGSAMERKCWVRWLAQQKLYPNLYVTLVGPPAVGKGTIMVPTRQIMSECNIYIAPNSASREQLAVRLNENSNQFEYDGRLLTYRNMCMFMEEFTALLTKNSSDMMSWLNDWYDASDTWSYETKNMGKDNMKNICVSLMGGTTPTLIQTTFPEEAKGGGFISRCNFVYANSRSCITIWPQDTQEESELNALLVEDLKKINSLAGEFTLSGEFKKKYEDWFPTSRDTPTNADINFLDYYGRRPLHLWKLAMIFSISQSDDLVMTGESFDRAKSVLEKTESVMHKAFQGKGKVANFEVMQKIMGMLQTNLRVPYYVIQKTFLRDLTVPELNVIIQSLQVSNLVDVEYENKKPILVWKGQNEDN